MKTLAIDFDDTICEGAFPDVGPIKPGAAAAIGALKALGYKIVIHSCRTSRAEFPARDVAKHEAIMRAFLRDHEIPFDVIWTGEGKPIAWAYIDDKAIRFEDNWPEIATRLMSGPLLPREFARRAGA